MPSINGKRYRHVPPASEAPKVSEVLSVREASDGAIQGTTKGMTGASRKQMALLGLAAIAGVGATTLASSDAPAAPPGERAQGPVFGVNMMAEDYPVEGEGVPLKDMSRQLVAPQLVSNGQQSSAVVKTRTANSIEIEPTTADAMRMTFVLAAKPGELEALKERIKLRWNGHEVKPGKGKVSLNMQTKPHTLQKAPSGTYEGLAQGDVVITVPLMGDGDGNFKIEVDVPKTGGGVNTLTYSGKKIDTVLKKPGAGFVSGGAQGVVTDSLRREGIKPRGGYVEGGYLFGEGGFKVGPVMKVGIMGEDLPGNIEGRWPKDNEATTLETMAALRFQVETEIGAKIYGFAYVGGSIYALLGKARIGNPDEALTPFDVATKVNNQIRGGVNIGGGLGVGQEGEGFGVELRVEGEWKPEIGDEDKSNLKGAFRMGANMVYWF